MFPRTPASQPHFCAGELPDEAAAEGLKQSDLQDHVEEQRFTCVECMGKQLVSRNISYSSMLCKIVSSAAYQNASLLYGPLDMPSCHIECLQLQSDM